MPLPKNLEDRFAFFWKRWTCGDRAPVRQFLGIPGRKFAFDFAWPSHKIAVEIQGGIGMYGRHNRPQGIRTDYEKHNLALLAGWRVIMLTDYNLRAKRAKDTIDLVRALINKTAILKKSSFRKLK